MTTLITANNIQPATLAVLDGPAVTNIQVTNSSYTVLDDTAVMLTGGYIKITGSNFSAGCTVVIGTVSATSVTFVNSTTLNVQVPAATAGTYIVYVINSDGAVAIRVNGLTYSSEPTWVTGSTLVGDSGTAVSIQLSATGASVYTLQAGSTLPANLTLTSGGLISGTVTIANDTLYNFTVIATDAELQDSPRAFSITITVGDPFFNSTTLLLPGSVTTFVKDSSTNNFPVTVVGDTKPNNFNPYLTGWSNFFDGTGDFLTVTELAGTNNNATVECWIYPITPVTVGDAFIVNNTGNGLGAWGISIHSTTRLISVWSDGFGSLRFTSTAAANLNTWTHVALVRISGILYLYINGVRQTGSYTTGTTFGRATTIHIGQYSAGGQAYTGYISNLRAVYGTAVYTDPTFTPPTAPLTAITNTSLLTCTDNRFIDESTYNFTITRNGDVKVQSFSPFVEPASTNGSGYFDGTGDYLTVPDNAAFDFTGDFTMEAWVYPLAYGTDNSIMCQWTAGLNFIFKVVSGNRLYFAGYPGSTVIVTGTTTTVDLNRWSHVAVSRLGTTVRLFVNGVLDSTTGVMSGTMSGTDPVTIGSLGITQYWNGYISNARIVKGAAVYTAAFTPPSQPLTAVTGTSLLTLQNNTPVANNTFVDSSSNNLLVTRAGNTSQGTFSPYSPSGWSVFFNGSTDFFNSSGGTGIGGTSFGYGTGDFTWEMWVYPTSSSWTTGNFYFMDHGNNNGVLQYNANAFRYYNGSTIYDTATGLIPANSWTHIAVSRISGMSTLYINGAVAKAATADTANYGTSQQLWIARYGAGGQNFPGYISNLRIVRGVGVYTGAFTPSTTPLTAAQSAGTNIAAITNQTILLICQDNSFVNESFVPLRFDGGTTLAIGGTPRVTNWSPFKAVVQTPTTYSAYFDGSGDYLTIPNNVNLTIGSGDFTIECWVYITGAQTTTYGWSVAGPSTNQGSTGWGLVVNRSVDSRGFGFICQNSFVSSDSIYLSAGGWVHLAVTRSGSGANNLKLFKNGVISSQTTYTTTDTYAASPVYIGADGTGGQAFPGYISNFRFVKGTAVYTANFTPSTTPLTAVANTSLLTCQSATFVDNSTNNFAITAAGNSQPTTVNPFGFTFTSSTGYTAAEYSGSMYFDGTGDYLTLPSTGGMFAFGTGNFTIEMWVNPDTVAPSYQQLGGATYSVSGGAVYLATSTATFYTNGNLAQTPVGSIRINQWQHIAVVRNAGVIKIYINGVESGSSANTQNLTTLDGQIGMRTGSTTFEPYKGYISNYRVIKGQALYTSNFAPPIAPVLPVQNTVVLLNGTSAAITDATTKNDLETVGDARISTAVAKFGGSSMYFDGAGDWIQVPGTNPSLAFGTGAFTVEFWFYSLAASGTQQLFDTRPAGTTSTSGYMALTYSGSLNYYTAGGNPIAGGAVSANAWHHVALTRSGTSTRMFVDGVQVGSTYTDTNTYLNGLNRPIIGADGNAPSASLTGYIQDFRITNGIARYTANFTPPSTAFNTK